MRAPLLFACAARQGYKLLFVILLASIGAILLQTQATRLGIVSGLDLARQTRLLLHDCKRHTLLIRWGVLYPIYVLVEIAIIAYVQHGLKSLTCRKLTGET
jgi:Mn2+/Fe2+ NRAMP family transporter